MSDETKTQPGMEPPIPVDEPRAAPSISDGESAATAAPEGTRGKRVTNGRLDTDMRLMAAAGEALHDGRALSAKMAAKPELQAKLDRLAEQNPDGSGPFRQRVGTDLLDRGQPSERVEAVSIPAAGSTKPGLGPAPSSDPVKRADVAEKAAVTPKPWALYGPPGEVSDTVLEAEASKLHIPRTAFASRAARSADKALETAAEAEPRSKGPAWVPAALLAVFAGAVVMIGLWIVQRSPRAASPDLPPVVTVQVAVPVLTAPVVVPATASPLPTIAPVVTADPPPAVPPVTPPPHPVKSAPPTRPARPPPPPSAPKPPTPQPPTTTAPAGPIYD